MAFALLLNRLVIFEKLGILRVLDTIANVKRQRNNVIDIFVDQLVVVAQVVKERLFVPDKMVELEVVVHADCL